MHPCRCSVFQNGVRDEKLIIRPMHTKTPDAAKKISKMSLPVDDWETMEHESQDSGGGGVREAGRRAGGCVQA